MKKKRNAIISALLLLAVLVLIMVLERILPPTHIALTVLKKGCIYSDIVEKTGASTATISRVNRALSYGKGGYNIILEQLEK